MSRAARRRASRGFTLIELTVALIAGLIVAMGIVALSKEATRTFHEEVRSAAAQATLRTAVDRLEADLQRAAYMSTTNIALDPMLAFAPGGPRLPATAPAVLRRLAGIHLYPGWSSTHNGLALSGQQAPALAPDMIEIAGNMTTAEQFEVMGYNPANGACTTLILAATSPAIFRILNNNVGQAGAPSPNADAEMRNLFQPMPAGDTTRFLVRFVDDTGHTQYLLTCPVANAAGLGQANALAPFLSIDTSTTPLVTAAQALTVSGVTGNAASGGTVHGWVNPIQVVRWEIVGPNPGQGGDSEPAQYGAGLGNPSNDGGVADSNKYDLMRSFVDVTSGQILATTSEIVAEYAVDLNFAFSVSNAQGVSLTSYPFDDPNHNGPVADDVSVQVTATPERIRSVRVRLVTRMAQADRTMNIPIAPTVTGTASFLYRYCTVAAGCSDPTALQWARARTDVVEVSLPNQARAFF